MNRLRNLLLLTAVVGAFGVVGMIASSHRAVAQSGTPVSIVSPLPLPVRDVRAEVRTPFQKNGFGSGALNVDPNQRLTIEFVSAICDVQKDSPGLAYAVTTTAGGTHANHVFFPRFVGPFTNTLNRYGHTDMARIYADPGTVVEISPSQCGWTLSGYTVPR